MPLFNLELMKLATYYKQHNEIVKLATTLEPERYTKFYVRKDWDDEIYPKQFFYKNVSYGGRAFSPQYKPLPLDIEDAIPDNRLYEQYYNNLPRKTPERIQMYTNQLNGVHLRASLDGKTLSKNFPRALELIKPTSKSIILHDYNITEQDEGYKAIQQIFEYQKSISRTNIYIGFKFPLEIEPTVDNIDKWFSFPTLKNFFSIRINNVMNDEVFKAFIQREESRCRIIEYSIIPPGSDENDFVMNVLPKIFKQVLYLSRHKRRFSLIYDNDFFIHEEWIKLLRLLNNFSSESGNKLYKKTQNVSFFDYIRRNLGFKFYQPNIINNTLPYTKAEIRQLFHFVKENNYELFKMFYEELGESYD